MMSGYGLIYNQATRYPSSNLYLFCDFKTSISEDERSHALEYSVLSMAPESIYTLIKRFN